MALINCKECGKQISDTAKICIHCGAKTETAQKLRLNRKDAIIATLVAIAMIAIVIIGMYYVKTSNPSYRYSKEAIKILENYKDNAITRKQAIRELNSLSYQVKEESEKKDNDTSLFLLYTKLGVISLKIELEEVDRIDINDYIEELKEF